LSWVDWSLRERNESLVEFVRGLIDLRKSRLWLRRDTFLKGTGRRGQDAKDVTWLHPAGREMTVADWNDSHLRSIAVHMIGAPSPSPQAQAGDLLVVFNADEAPVTMSVPSPSDGRAWAVVFDTSGTGASDAVRILQRNEKLVCEQRSTVLLESRSITQAEYNEPPRKILEEF
jgi:isoamylase